jgi:N utilization substance protein B
MSQAGSKGTGARTRARELLVQALYQKQIADHSLSELSRQFHDQPAYQRVDQEFFDEHLAAICEQQQALQAAMDQYIDRPLEQLDPVELGIMLIGVYELQSRIEIPFKVVINECVNLARRFGSVEGHKYINACLDVAARSLRKTEAHAKTGE